MTVSCPERRPDLGAYVVGALEPGERAALEAHLPGCQGCRDELAELAGLPGMLARLSPEEVEPAPAPPEHLGRRVVDELARRKQRTRRVRLSLVAAGCALVLGIGGAVASTQWTGSGPEPPSTVATALDHGTHVRARAELSPEPWGTEVALRLSNVTPGTRCRLIAVGEDGRREVAGTWRADYEGNATVRAATAIPLADLGRLVVVADRQGPLVSVPV
jgi:hypothetical protein